MAEISALFPVREAMVDRNGIVREPWRIWFRDQAQTVNSQPVLTNPVVILEGKTASVSTTPFNTGTLAKGFYRFNYYMTCATPAGVSSGLIVTASWTDHGSAQSRSSANMTGNLVTTTQSEVWPLHIDANSPVSYALTYAATPAAAAIFNAYLVLETVAV